MKNTKTTWTIRVLFNFTRNAEKYTKMLIFVK